MAVRMVAIVALSAASIVAAALARSPSAPLYTFAATEACMKRLPDSVAGLPPATPPLPPVLFVHSYPPYRSLPVSEELVPRVRRRLGAWYGGRGKSTYQGVTLTFFKTVQGARTFVKLPDVRTFMRGARVARNVVIDWDRRYVSAGRLETAVRSCLRAASSPGETSAPKRSIPQASLATFAGSWGGHTRGLNVTSRGRGSEGANSGCCQRVYEMTFQLLSVSGTLTRATAAYGVTSFRRYVPSMPRLHRGQVGKLLLKNGVVTNTLTEDYFCSDPAWNATSACGL